MKSAGSLKGAYGALNGVYWMLCCLAYSFSSNFLLGRGYSNSRLGAIVAAGYILGLLLQPLAAAVADRTARAPVAVIACSAGAVGLAALAVLFLPGKGPAVTAVYGLFLTLIIMLQPLVNAFAYYIERLGTPVPFGVCRAVGSLAYGALGAVLGGLIRRAGENVVPAAGVLTAVLMAGLMAWFASAGTPAASEEQKGPAEGTSGGVLRDRGFRALLLASVLLYFGHSFQSGYMIQIVRGVGGDDGDMGLLTLYVAALELPAMFLFERLLHRFSCGGMLRFAAVFFAVKNLLVLLAGSVGALYGGMSFQLIAFALFIPASVRYAGELSGPRDANRAQAWVTALCTAGSVCASGLGGVLIDRLGLRAALAVTAASSCAGALVMVLGVRRGKTGEKRA